METLLPLASSAAGLLKARGETIAVSQSSVGGLVSAALIAQAGASAFFLGGAVIYTREAGRALLQVNRAALEGKKPLTADYVAVMAEQFRAQMGADWALAEMGAAGPDGSPYGPAPGTAALAVAGPQAKAEVISTGLSDRVANMRAFGAAALTQLIGCLEDA